MCEIKVSYHNCILILTGINHNQETQIENSTKEATSSSSTSHRSRKKNKNKPGETINKSKNGNDSSLTNTTEKKKKSETTKTEIKSLHTEQKKDNSSAKKKLNNKQEGNEKSLLNLDLDKNTKKVTANQEKSDLQKKEQTKSNPSSKVKVDDLPESSIIKHFQTNKAKVKGTEFKEKKHQEKLTTITSKKALSEEINKKDTTKTDFKETLEKSSKTNTQQISGCGSKSENSLSGISKFITSELKPNKPVAKVEAWKKSDPAIKDTNLQTHPIKLNKSEHKETKTETYLTETQSQTVFAKSAIIKKEEFPVKTDSASKRLFSEIVSNRSAEEYQIQGISENTAVTYEVVSTENLLVSEISSSEYELLKKSDNKCININTSKNKLEETVASTEEQEDQKQIEKESQTESYSKEKSLNNLSKDKLNENITTEKLIVSENESTKQITENTPRPHGEEIHIEDNQTNITFEMASKDKTKSSIKKTNENTQNNCVDLRENTQIRVLTLNDSEHLDSTLYRLEKNWIIQFRLGPSLLGRKVSLYFNYPEDKADFERNRYQLLKWNLDKGCEHSDDTALFTEVVLKVSGSFHYYFTYDNSENNSSPNGSGFILVDPVLKYGKNENLPLDCIQCQTVLAKSLGSFSSWENKLRVTKESGYNMIHFTPIQQLGASNSSYCLSEQLKLNPLFNSNDKKVTFDDIEKFIAKLRTEWKIVSICDIVLNHTANESLWLKDHPEVTYNCKNCPYLRPAYLIDAALHHFSNSVKNGVYEERGIPAEISNEDHINALRYYIHKDIIEPLNLQELFICDVNKYVVDFLSLARNKVPAVAQNHNQNEELKLIQDPQYRRLSSTIDMNVALHNYNIYRSDCFDEETRIKKCGEEFKHKLDSLNQIIIDELKSHLNAAVENVLAGIRYFRVQNDGPRVKEISEKNPLVFRYFTDYGNPKDIKESEEIMYSENGRFLMAHNGWVMNDDPLRNFAASNSNVYLRRELIAWGDSVKLRYGNKPDDCPFLWNYMKTYVEKTAKIFDGVRLDNCHSTPIPVAEYLLDCARKVRPNLYIAAELFTNSDQKDNIFVNRLGITSLIREAMSAWDSHEQGRLVYRYGGCPVGSFFQPNIRPLVPSIAHALFLDLTHDNPSPIEKRSVFDLLPSTALVNMACCASGSNRGYDELVPHHIHVVDENREYTEWTETDLVTDNNPRYISLKSGIISAKKALNELHFKLGMNGFDQVYVDQMDPDIVAVTRHNPKTHETYVLVAFTAFSHPNQDAALYQRSIRPLIVEGVLDEIVLECTLSHIKSNSDGSKYEHSKHTRDKTWINGLNEYVVDLKQHITLEKSDVFEKANDNNNITHLNFKNFKPGSVVAIKISQPDAVQIALKNVRDLIKGLNKNDTNELWKIIKKTNLSDLNRILYRCDQEERDDGNGFDTYNIPNFGSTVYAGFQGFVSLLANIRPSNDLGHPLCNNLRQGNWMIDYLWKRLLVDEGTKDLGQWIEENIKPLKEIPRYLIPCYFDVIVTSIYSLLLEQSYSLMNDFVINGSSFVKGLSLGSLQFGGYVQSSDLPVLSPNLKAPKPPTRKSKDGNLVQSCVTLSAGLPHFSVGYMRNWGRDTFIALRGLFILTGRYQDARYHILGYAACLRHGLIPNLLDGGRNPRYNCRDAVWWWLYCIKCYVEEAPNGIGILNDKVSRIFPNDDAPAQEPGVVDQLLKEVMQESLQVHFQGLIFRERNAGRQIDAHMSDKGFNNQIGVHPETGFIFGGNEANCGTWMDKMGSSDKAGNRGKPATPRDGSAIELIGLSKAVITWLHNLNQQKQYPYEGVERISKNGSVIKWTFKQWADKIQQNFETHFWINTTPVKDENRPDLINKRGIYKDCFGASQEWTDFQLRCNFPITMVVAPELFNPQNAWIALQNAEKHLLGPLGMKTLDPDDWAYCGDYDNSNDSNEMKIANGFNYHQGPEWVWPVGFFLRAKLHFAAQNGQLKQTIASTKVILSKHFIELQTSMWRGLPELTNSNGSYCHDSSRTQAWSMSSILEVLHDLQQLETKLLVSGN